MADARFVWHPYTQHGLPDAPIAIERARGRVSRTSDSGRRIFDAISSWWVTLHGHAQPEIAAAIAEQARTLEQVIFAGFTHEPAARLAAELVARAPAGLQRVFFSDDGSTAVEVAVKIALQYWQNRGEDRRTIAALDNAYHGDTFGAMSVSARGLFTEPFASKLFDVARLPDPVDGDVVARARRADRRARRGHRGGHRRTAAARRRRNAHVAGRRRCARCASSPRPHGILLIADEVLTGFGRTGPLFACEHAGVSPDLMCLSKGLTGGFVPLGATLATEALFDAFRSEDRKRTLFHGHSFTANPIACAAALASLALLDDACAGRRRAIESDASARRRVAVGAAGRRERARARDGARARARRPGRPAT